MKVSETAQTRHHQGVALECSDWKKDRDVTSDSNIFNQGIVFLKQTQTVRFSSFDTFEHRLMLTEKKSTAEFVGFYYKMDAII